MKSFKTTISIFLLINTLTNGYAQMVTKTQRQEFSVTENVVIDINSKYTNLEFELTDEKVLTVEAIMQVEGLTENDVEVYFRNWNFKATKHGSKVMIASVLQDGSNIQYKKKGYYQGFFLDTDKIMTPMPKKKSKSSNTPKKKGEFDFDAYIENGNVYLKQWEKENNEKIGRRFYNKTKEERIALRRPKKEARPELDSKPAILDKIALKNKSMLPNVNVRNLSKRAVINKTLKVKIPRKAKLNIKARHGKVVFVEEIKDLKAELSYVLLKAKSISGTKTIIKGSYSNFEIDYWKDGGLDVVFSDYTLINEVQNMVLTSSASTVSIDNVTNSIDARGNFKMLSIDASAEIKYVNVDVEDSNKVWLKLPKTAYNMKYEGINSKLIYPKQFTLKMSESNPGKQTIERNLLKNNERAINIKSLSSIMQIYDIPWENLKIKNL